MATVKNYMKFCIFRCGQLFLILKYLKRTKDMFIICGGEKELVVNGYIDASFDTDPDDSKSQTRYMFIMVELSVGVVPSRASWWDLRVKRIT